MSKLKLTTLATQDGSASVPADTIVNGTAKAWVNFNGTGAVAIRRAFNVSSITDNGTGDYTVNFTTAMVDANYAVSVNGSRNAMSNTDAMQNPYSFATTSVSVGYNSNNGTPVDVDALTVIIFR